LGYTKVWKCFSRRTLNIAIQAFSLISIFLEGYDQCVMGGVNASPYYVTEVGIGEPDGTVTKTTTKITTKTTNQGGIVSIYYLGCIFGCFIGGRAGDRIGRINGIFYVCFFALIGGALQAATQNLEFILVARVITGIGTGALTGITPVLISEVSASDHRGGLLGYIFIANYLGDSVAYWLPLGPAFINDGYSDVRWRFLLAFQCFQALLLLAGIKVLPDSPRFYAAVGQFEKAKEVLI
jgi:MFS family permease